MARYRNPNHNPHDDKFGPEFYETDAKPTEYKGFQIYHVHNLRFDCVQEGLSGPVCKMQMAGLNGAKRYIDKFWARENAA
jgi:hypothetical protein